MKKVILKFYDSVLSREQLKGIKGGDGPYGGGTNECTSLGRESCIDTVKCRIEGNSYEGKCGWTETTNPPVAKCTCGVVGGP